MGDRLLVLNNVILMQAMQAEMEAAAGVLVMMRRRRWRQRRASNFWVRPWLQTERRLLYGHYDRLMEELRQEDQQSFFNFIRMPPEMFDELLNRVGPRIQLQDTNFRRALEPGLKLAVTLRHLSISPEGGLGGQHNWTSTCGPPSTRRPKCAIFPTWRRCLRPQNLLDETLRLTGTDQRGDDSQLQVLKRQKGSWECIWHP